MRASELLGDAERERLAGVIREVERATGGEIVVAVASACDEYGSAGWRLGVALAALAFLGLGLFAPPLPWVAYLAAQAAMLLLGHALARRDGVRRALVDDALVEQRVAERARHAFAEYGLERTRGRTGILIFVAVFERRVVVLADEGIHRALAPHESWTEVVERATSGLHSGVAAVGLESAVRRCGEILARHLPAQIENPDELPNAVVIEPD
jgi:putative membrane protein